MLLEFGIITLSFGKKVVDLRTPVERIILLVQLNLGTGVFLNVWYPNKEN